jgi:hypothetical protein
MLSQPLDIFLCHFAAEVLDSVKPADVHLVQIPVQVRLQSHDHLVVSTCLSAGQN